MDQTKDNTPNMESWCEHCKLDTVSHHKRSGTLVCRKCSRVSDNHYITRENEVKNFENDHENNVLSRVEYIVEHPLYKSDDFIHNDGQGGNYKKQTDAEKKQEKNFQEVEKILRLKLRKIPMILTNNVFRSFYRIAKNRLDEIQKVKNQNAQLEKEKKTLLTLPSYGIEAIRIDAAIAMYEELAFEAGSKEVLYEKVLKKMNVKVEKMDKRIKDLKSRNIIQKSSNNKPIDFAIEKARTLHMTEEEIDVLKKIAQTFENKSFQGGEQSLTVAGVILFLVCNNSKNPNINRFNLKDISGIVDKNETTLKKFYEDKVQPFKEQVLPVWSTRAYNK